MNFKNLPKQPEVHKFTTSQSYKINNSTVVLFLRLKLLFTEFTVFLKNVRVLRVRLLFCFHSVFFAYFMYFVEITSSLLFGVMRSMLIAREFYLNIFLNILNPRALKKFQKNVCKSSKFGYWKFKYNKHAKSEKMAKNVNIVWINIFRKAMCRFFYN